jgi:Uri superfamily endonuclease
MPTIQSTEIQPIPGTYALILQAAREQTIAAGRLGELQVRPGFYAYIGSAFGPGGLRARISRHLRQTSVQHWHIDYLKQAAIIQEAWFSYDPVRKEHAWAQAFQILPDAAIPLLGFGSSDCRCAAHLFYFRQSISPDDLFASTNPLYRSDNLYLYRVLQPSKESSPPL